MKYKIVKQPLPPIPLGKKSFFSPSFKLEIIKNFGQILDRLVRILKNLPRFTSLTESREGEEFREEFKDVPEDIEILTPS